MRTTFAATLALLATLYCLPPLSAQETGAEPSTQNGATGGEITELRERLDRLEQENEALKQTVTERLPAAAADAESGGGQRFYNIDTAVNQPAPADGSVRSVVEQVLAEQKAADKAAADAKKEAEAEAGYEVGKDLTMSANWKNGLEVSSKDKAFRVHVGGRYQLDTSWYDTSDAVQSNINNPYRDGIDFRRLRFRIDGTMYETIDWALEFDFINSARLRTGTGTAQLDTAVTAPTDAWWTFTKLPVVGNIRVGNQKEAIGFEHLVSSRYLPFMERSYNQDTFYGGSFNGFTPGVSVFNSAMEDRATWNIGFYKPATNVFSYNNNDGDYAVTGRLTALPCYLDEGRSLVHFGFSARHATTYAGRYRFRTRDAIRSGISSTWPNPADTGDITGKSMQWLNGEMAAVHGPWTFQSEYLVSLMQDAQSIPGQLSSPGAPIVAGDNLVYHGGYVQLLCFLTGENDKYSFERATFDRVIPHENFFMVGDEDGCRAYGLGAWQTGARYDYLDLNDQGINGGILHNFTYGLNWFLNPNMKVQFNYFATYRDVAGVPGSIGANPINDGSGWIHGWGTRFAHDF